MNSAYLPAEWQKQAFIQLTWPHEQTDWAYMLADVEKCYIDIARNILSREALLIVTPWPEHITELFKKEKIDTARLHIIEAPTNDTWARDHAFITMISEDGKALLKDFRFNGWGLKFAANLDNMINRNIYRSGAIGGRYDSCLDFVLEGGSIESDGEGTLLTTSQCLLSVNRNDTMSRIEIENYLKNKFSLNRILWLDHGFLEGDDTDSHVDTLARLCPDDTIVYVKCSDAGDVHYQELAAMEKELETFTTTHGKAYRLLPLPLPHAVYDESGMRLPATYANFLIMNDAVLYPTYRQPQNDSLAAEVLKKAFPQREIIGIDCSALIRQHGSLHCITMQYPECVTIK